MFNEPLPPVIQKRMSFLSVSVMCLTAVLITVIVSAAGIGVYALRLVDRKADGIVGLVSKVTEHMPELRDSLPPAILDAMDDERRPEYASSLRVNVKLVGDESRPNRRRAVVEVENKGNETVNLMTIRLVALDKNGDPVGEKRTWVASPLQMDGDWRGPLLPRETRKFTVRSFDERDTASVSYEITEIRVWNGNDSAPEDADNNEVMAKGRATAPTKPSKLTTAGI